MSQIERARAAAALVACTALSAAVLSAQQATPPQATPQTAPPQTTGPRPAMVPAPQGPVAAQAGRRSSSTAQGFSVVLVLGDLQGTNVPDDVPVAAKRALTDMRDFLPFKSYRLLDAAWLMCCGESRPGMVSTTGDSMARNIATQMLRGPEEQEYELRLSTSRGEGGRVLVRFTLGGSTGEAMSGTAAASTAASIRTTQRKIEDLQDRAQLLQTQIKEARGKVEVGIAAGGEIPKLEVELRSVQREIRDLEQRLQQGASATVTRSMQRGGSATERSIRSSIMDTSFSMDVGETVVVGTSRLKGGNRALIALLTAVPARR